MNSRSLSHHTPLVPVHLDAALPDRASALVGLARRLLFAQLAKIEHGELVLIEAGLERHFGRRTPRFDHTVSIHVDHPQMYVDTVFGGTVGVGEAYIRGLWRCDDLTSLVRLFVVNRHVMDGMDSRWSLLSRPLLKFFHWLNRNSKHGSARNIRAHYDLGNNLYELMLDETLAYSCGIFPQESTSLNAAQLTKFDVICRKLDLKPGDELLEIGTGWGGLAIHAAQKYGARVTTTTISREQFE